MIRALVIGFIHACLYVAMTLGLGAWLLSNTSDNDLQSVQLFGHGVLA